MAKDNTVRVEAQKGESPKTDAAPQVEAQAASDAVEAGPEIVRKLSPKEVVGDKLKKLVMEGTIKLPCDLFSLIGRAANLRDGESDFGPWTSLVGEFEATRLFDGSNHRLVSTQAFIPGAAGELLTRQVREFITKPIEVTPEQFKKTGRTYEVTGDYVEMALVIGAKLSEREGGAPYEFTVRPIVPVQRADSLGALREKMLKALPAPKK